MANESLLITCLPDGTYHVKTTEDASEDAESSDAAMDQSVKTSDEVMQMVQSFLSSEDGEMDSGADMNEQDMPENPAMKNGADDSAAWNDEAKSRDASGYRK